MKKILVAVAFLVATAGLAQAQNQANAPNGNAAFKGQIGQWTMRGVLTGDRANFTLTCSGGDFPGLTVKVGTGGEVDSYITTGSGRRRIKGRIPGEIVLDPGGACGGGSGMVQ